MIQICTSHLKNEILCTLRSKSIYCVPSLENPSLQIILGNCIYPFCLESQLPRGNACQGKITKWTRIWLIYYLTLWVLNAHICAYHALCTICDVIIFKATRYFWKADHRARTDQSTQLSVLDIDRFPSEQMEENALSFWCKNGDEKAYFTYRWSRTNFQALTIVNTHFFKVARKDVRSKR